MTETEIEYRVERMIDHLDRLLLAGELSQKQYRTNVEDLANWAAAKYAANQRAVARR